jgi:hypothetical protein
MANISPSTGEKQTGATPYFTKKFSDSLLKLPTDYDKNRICGKL